MSIRLSIASSVVFLLVSGCGGGGSSAPPQATTSQASNSSPATPVAPSGPSTSASSPDAPIVGSQLSISAYAGKSTLSLFEAYGHIYGVDNTTAQSRSLFKLSESGDMNAVLLLGDSMNAYPDELSDSVWYSRSTGFNQAGYYKYDYGRISETGALSTPLYSDNTNNGHSLYDFVYDEDGNKWELFEDFGGGLPSHHGTVNLTISGSVGTSVASVPLLGDVYEVHVTGMFPGPDSRIYIAIEQRNQSEVDSLAPVHHMLAKMNPNGGVEQLTDLDSKGLACGLKYYIFAPDGNYWVYCNGGISKFDLKHMAVVGSAPYSYHNPGQVMFGPDGNAWFNQNNQYMGIDPFTGKTIYQGSFVEDAWPTKYILGSDGRLWTGDASKIYAVSGFSIPTPGNDDFEAATPLTGDSGTVYGTPFKATSESGEPNHTGLAQSAQRSLWWSWTAPGDGVLVLNTIGSAPSAAVAVYTGDNLQKLLPLTDPSRDQKWVAKIKVTAGVKYKIAVDNYYRLGGIDILSFQYRLQ